eukprot:749977-Hanusia_phi.AAC.1
MHVEDVPYFRSSSHFALDIPPRNDLILAVPCVLYAYESGGDCDPRSYINRTLAHLPESKHIFSKIYATASAGIMNLSNPVSWSLENGVVKVHIDFERGTNYSTSARIRTENSKIFLTFQSGETIAQFSNSSIVAELELSTNPANYHVLIEIRLSVCAMSIWLNDRLEKVGKCQSAAGLEKWADESGFGFFGKPPTNFPVDISLDGSSTESILKPFLRIYEADYQAIRNSPLVHVSCKLCLDSDLKYFADKLVSYNDGNYLSDLSNVWWKLGTISLPIPAYGVDGFWSTTALLDNQTLQHRSRLAVECKNGHRKGIRFASHLSSELFMKHMQTGDLNSANCLPVQCGVFIPLNNASVRSSGKLLFGETVSDEVEDKFIITDTCQVIVECPVGTRAMPNRETHSAPIRDACSYNRTYQAVCNDSCGYDFNETVMPWKGTAFCTLIHVLECNLVSCGKLDLTPSNARVKGLETNLVGICSFHSSWIDSVDRSEIELLHGQEYWTSGNNEIFSTINVTCKEGYRASTGVGIVDCDFPSVLVQTDFMYILRHETGDARKLTTSNSETIILFNRTLTVTCATGYIPWRTDGSNQSNTNIFPEPQYDAITNSWRQTSCSGMTFQERCQSDCTFTKSWSCESATCPPYSSLNLNSFTVGESTQPQSSTNAANTLESCSIKGRLPQRLDAMTVEAGLGSNDCSEHDVDCIYRRRDVVNGSLSCLVISCGELQIPPNALIAWQSGDSTRPTAIWNDTITCSSDGTFRLVDMQSEALQKDFSVAATGEKLVLSRTEIQGTKVFSPFLLMNETEFFSSNPVGGPESTCSNLACGCGQCLQKLDFLRPLNYSEIVDLGTEQELPGYVSPHYITRKCMILKDISNERSFTGTQQLNSYASPDTVSKTERCLNTTCAAPNDDGVDGEAASVVKFWNCGFLEPPPCEPLHCPTFDPPANSQVVTSTWSTDRKYGYGDSSEIEIVCETGYFRSDSNEHQCLQSWKIKCGVKDANTRVMLPNGQFLLANQLSGVVQYSESVTIRWQYTTCITPSYQFYSNSCVESYAFSKEGSRNLICQQNCQFDSVATTCVGSSVEPNNYFSGLQPLNAFQKVEIKCKIGYVLDNSTGPVVVAGLESLGPVKVLDNKLFPPPTDGGTLGLASSGVQISMPKGIAMYDLKVLICFQDVWPTDAGALSITVIDLNAIFSLRRKLLADDGGKLLSMGYNFGPDGVQVLRDL